MPSNIHLPDECWESVLRFLNNNQYHHYIESLSLVSKQFLSITNHLRFSLAISDQTLPFLPRLLRRFPNLTSLDLTRFHGDLDALLLQISQFPLPHLTSLNFSYQPRFPTNGLRAFAEKVKTLTSLTCSYMGFLSMADLQLIVDCFPLLQELDISFPKHFHDDKRCRLCQDPLPLALPKLLRKVNLSGKSFIINDATLVGVCRSCEFLEDLVIFKSLFLTQSGIASAIRERPGLRSFSIDTLWRTITTSLVDSLVSLKNLTCLDFRNLSISDELLCSVAEQGLPLRKLVLDDCTNYSYDGISYLLSKCQFIQHLDLQKAEFLNDEHVSELSNFLGNLTSVNIGGCGRIQRDKTFFSLISNCPLLSEIKMEGTRVGEIELEYPDDFMIGFVNPHVKSLRLAYSLWLRDQTIIMLSSICPNLEMLDLTCCKMVSETSVVEVLRRCCKIRHLSIAKSEVKKLNGMMMNFEVPNVEVLSLAGNSGVDDETLSLIQKSFSGLLYLDLEFCPNVTAEGVWQVVGNCKRLRQINSNFYRSVARNGYRFSHVKFFSKFSTW